MIVFDWLTRDMTRSVLGQSMHNLAETYSALGRHQDALVLHEKTLEFRRRFLPENHKDIGISCLNACVSYGRSGDNHRASNRAREALQILQATLPLSHPLVQIAQKLIRDIEGDTARCAPRR